MFSASRLFITVLGYLQSALMNRKYGLFGGLGTGLLVGVFISGPNFYVWPASTSLAVIGASIAVGGFIGSFVVTLAVGSLIGGSGVEGSAERHDFSGRHEHQDSSGEDGPDHAGND